MLTEVKQLTSGYELLVKGSRFLIDPCMADDLRSDVDCVLFTGLFVHPSKELLLKLAKELPTTKILIFEGLRLITPQLFNEVDGLGPFNSFGQERFKCTESVAIWAIPNIVDTIKKTQLFDHQASIGAGVSQPLGGEHSETHLVATSIHRSIADLDLTDLSTARSTVCPTSPTNSLAGYVIEVGDTRLLLLGSQVFPSQSLLSRLSQFENIHSLAVSVGIKNRFETTAAIHDDSRQYDGLTVHEALILAGQLNIEQAVLYPIEPLSASEIRAALESLQIKPQVLIAPAAFYMGRPRASVVIRTLNEGRYLDELLTAIRQQRTRDLDCEVVIVDSGSTDETLAIAEKHGCTIVHIKRENFSFGRSLNIGCEEAKGEVLVITSGHCVPASSDWLKNLSQPLVDGIAQYSYGKQLGGPNSYYSECRVFQKYFPDASKLPQEGFYCNNANSAILKSSWQRYRFDEELTGLEDMALAQWLVRDGGKVAYVSDAPVYHYHNENWSQVRRRFEREAIALQKIMPNVHIGWLDALKYTLSSIWGDVKKAAQSKQLLGNFTQIVRYRYYQYTGSYRGNQQHRKLSQAEKDQYFYPH
jgi:glycosyltransferase involved in cell wall biosynthesis